MTLSVIRNEPETAADAPRRAPAAEPLVVLKFGSSVLRTTSDLPAAAGEIYRQRRLGQRILVVVSALAGETDRLFAEASLVGQGTRCAGTADLVSLGEERTAALLKIACSRIGLDCAICRPEELGLHTEGPPLDSDFAELLPFALARKLESQGIVIVPGFVGMSESGERTLLGRGGSDYTAAILGGELGAGSIRLYKDVDGVFESDPAIAPKARKFKDISYERALEVAKPLVHSKALKFAARKGVAIEVECIGSNRPTRIGGQCRIEEEQADRRPLRIALAGFGVVGQALARRLENDPRFRIGAILVRDLSRPRDVPPPVPLTDNPVQFARAKADVLVELLSCERRGASLICSKLQGGIPVVTASKRVVSERFCELTASAAAGRAELFYSAAVGGSAPFVETARSAARLGAIEQVDAILNGTVNYLLGRLHEGAKLEEALEEARQAGFAEEDCEADLCGGDAAAKLKILAHEAFGIAPHHVEVECERLDGPLAARIRESGQRWVQLSRIRRSDGAVSASVGFCPADCAPIPPAIEEWNAGVIRLADGRELAVRGRGAGGAATAEAVLADLYDLLGLRSSQADEPRQACAPAASPETVPNACPNAIH